MNLGVIKFQDAFHTKGLTKRGDFMVKLAPSMFSADFAFLARDVEIVENAGVEYLHIDVMDGMFVPNMSIGPQVVKCLRPHSKLVFDVHLMIVEPERYVENFIKAGADIITFHYEATEKVEDTIKLIRELGAKPSISIKPKTQPEEIEHLIKDLDMILIMSVEPGFGGQSFIPESLDKIARTRELIEKHNPACELEVDGGIYTHNVAEVVKAGANVIVAGSAIFNAPDIVGAVKEFRKNIAI
jgi:ribulose-phosphate 3-epimerase